MNYIRQLIYDMRHHRMMTWISISGTAISIFLVMVFFMVNSLSTVEEAPESRRHLIYGAPRMFVEVFDGESRGKSANGGMTYEVARQLYENLEGVELATYVSLWNNPVRAMAEAKAPLSVNPKYVDSNFWKIFDFTFIDGKPFSEDELLITTMPPIVLTEKVARKIFGDTSVVGREINIGGIPHIVKGVVKDVNPILKNAFAEIYLPLGNSARGSIFNDPDFAYVGNLQAFLLLKDKKDVENVNKQLNSRSATLNSRLREEYIQAKNIENIMAPEAINTISHWNSSPNVAKVAEKRFLIYLLLLLLPAINLSSMMRGRMRHRISEIGLRRAYGASRLDIIRQFLGENLVVTFVGGIIGLLFSYLFMTYLSSNFLMFVDSWRFDSLDVQMATPSFGMLFTWTSFFIALGACLVLNILTAGLPAWRASKLEPSTAISKSTY